MNQEQIIQMAQEAGWKDLRNYDFAMNEFLVMGDFKDLERFAKLVAEHSANVEREACAKVADTISDKYGWGHYGNEVDTADEIASAIRARGQA